MEETASISVLQKYGYPLELVTVLKNNGIHTLHSNQSVSLLKGLLNGNSFLISSPSGSGKTLIGEIAALHHFSNQGEKSLFLFPLRALVNEKCSLFEKRYRKFNLRCSKSTGGQEIPQNELNNSDILFMTYEKFDSYLRNEYKNPWIQNLSLVVIDEVHTIGSNSRGIYLENMIVRMFKKFRTSQFIFLSATIGNPEEFHAWLNFRCQTYKSQPIELVDDQERPIPLSYSIKMTKNKNEFISKLINVKEAKDGQILVFTNTRKDTKATCDDILISLNKINQKKNLLLLTEYIQEKYPNLDKTKISQWHYILNGVGYHHAGLTQEEKTFIEDLFRQRFLKVLVSTSTLSTGINTPSRIVVIKNIYIFDKIKVKSNSKKSQSVFKRRWINRNEFHQLCGRAGRAQYDDAGLAIILVESIQEKLHVEDNFFSKSNSCKWIPKYEILRSKLAVDQEILEEIILLKIFEEVSVNSFEIVDYLKETYMFHQFNQNLSIAAKLNLVPLDFISMLNFMERPELYSYLNDCTGKVTFLEYQPKKKVMVELNINYNGIQPSISVKFPPTYRCVLQFHAEKGVAIDSAINDRKMEKNFGPRQKIGGFTKDIEKSTLFITLYILNSVYRDSIFSNSSLMNFHYIADFKFASQDFQDIEEICYHALFPPSITENLLHYGLISQVRSSKSVKMLSYSYTSLGEICLKSYLSPRNTYRLYIRLERYLAAISVFSMKDLLKLFSDIVLSKLSLNISLFLESIESWINESPLDIILSHLNINKNLQVQEKNFLELTEFVSQLMMATSDILRVFFSELNFSTVTILARRLKYGLKEDLLDFLKNHSYDDILSVRRELVNGRLLESNYILN